MGFYAYKDVFKILFKKKNWSRFERGLLQRNKLCGQRFGKNGQPRVGGGDTWGDCSYFSRIVLNFSLGKFEAESLKKYEKKLLGF